jgi:hypothetical protein
MSTSPVALEDRSTELKPQLLGAIRSLAAVLINETSLNEERFPFVTTLSPWLTDTTDLSDAQHEAVKNEKHKRRRPGSWVIAS